MAKGRPVKSLIRERMQAIVDTLGVTYGYEIFKLYNEVFEPVDLRSMYYHLAKGVKLGEFEEVGVKQVKGQFTWGDISIRKYYLLGPQATSRTTPELEKAAEKLGFKRKEPKDFVVWDDVISRYVKEIKEDLEKIKTKTGSDKKIAEKIDSITKWLEGLGYKKVDVIVNLKAQIKKEKKK